jgi:hypothetical protein
MRFEQNVHLRLGMIKETVGCFGLAPALTGLGHAGLRASVKITCQDQQPALQPLIAQQRPAEFLLGPIGWRRSGRRRRTSTQLLARLRVQRIHPNFASFAPCACEPPIHAMIRFS